MIIWGFPNFLPPKFEIRFFEHSPVFWGFKLFKMIKKDHIGVFCHKKSFAPGFIHFTTYFPQKYRFYGFESKFDICDQKQNNGYKTRGKRS